MSAKISKALSAQGIVQYHGEKSAVNYSSSYYTENGKAVGVFHGRACAALGLQVGAPVTEEALTRLANGQHPLTGEQLIQWKRPVETEPVWVKNQDAWEARVEGMLLECLQREGGDPLHAVGTVEEARTRGTKVDPIANVPNWREAALLEMHAIARQTFIDNLQSEEGTRAREYLRTRGIHGKAEAEVGIGLSDGSGRQLVDKLRHYGPELMRASGLFCERSDGSLYDRFRDRLMFPIENERGETIAFGGRRGPEEKCAAKYINSPETEIYRKGETLYNLHRASDAMASGNEAVVVEGYLDAIAAYQAGQRNVVAPCGTAFTADQAKILRERAATVVLNFDEDDAGRRATERAIETAMDAGLTPKAMLLDQDPADWIKEHKGPEYKAAVREALPLVPYCVGRAQEKFATKTLEGQIDAQKWMRETLGTVPEAFRAEVSAALRAHLGLSPEEEKPPAMEHRAGWDLTFSAPKTFSLTALVGGDHRLVQAHDEAVREALDYGERSIQVKMGGLNAPQTTQKLVAALFRHDTARPVDDYAAPQLHTHCVIFNMSPDADGQFRALNPSELFHLQTAMDAVYMAYIGKRAKELGYETTHGANHAIEIKGYTQEYLDAESKRGEAIQAEKDRLNQHGPKADGYIALNTRAAKLDKSPEEIQAAHRAHNERYGNQAQRVAEEARERQREIPNSQERAHMADCAVEYAKNRLSERTTVMEWYEVDRDALRLSRGNFTLGDVAGAVGRAKGRGEFQEVAHWRQNAPESRYTTPELRAKEQKILQWMADGKGQAPAIAGGITRDEFREKFRGHLNDGQKHLVWNIIHSQDRMVGVQGIAGSGKTTAMGVLKTFAEDYGFEVRGVAATGGAANQMTDAGILANTLAGFLVEDDSKRRPARLYLLDEASLADIHQMADFLERLRPEDRVVVIGDVRQHGSVGAGRIFAELQQAGMDPFHLRTIVRQQPDEYKEAVKQVARGEIKEAITALYDRCRTHEIPDATSRHKGFALMFAQDPSRTLGIAPGNRECAALTEAIRGHLRETGRLGAAPYRSRILAARSEMQKEDLRYAINYNPGDVLVYSQRNQMGLRNGDRASVMQIDPDRNLLTVLRESDGKTFTYGPRRVGTSVGVYEPTYREFAEGDRVQFTKNLKTQGVTNRQLGTIVSLTPDGLARVQLDGKKTAAGEPCYWTGQLDRIPFLDHGYVMTSYSSQGATADRVLIHLDTDAPHTSRMLTQQLLYVAMSRGRLDVHLFTDNLEELTEMLYRLEQAPMALAPAEIECYREAIAAAKDAQREKAVGRGVGV